jgi:hypothetical protein
VLPSFPLLETLNICTVPYIKYAKNSIRRICVNKAINTVDETTAVPVMASKMLIRQRNAIRKFCSLYLFIAFLNWLFLEPMLIASTSSVASNRLAKALLKSFSE